MLKLILLLLPFVLSVFLNDNDILAELMLVIQLTVTSPETTNKPIVPSKTRE